MKKPQKEASKPPIKRKTRSSKSALSYISDYAGRWLDDQIGFFKECKISQEEVDSAKLHWHELAKIYDDHKSREVLLSTTANTISQIIQGMSKVHSVRLRIKDPASLIGKIVRKRKADPNRDINYNNYKDEITDLIGIRILHLLKSDWESIHRGLFDHFSAKGKPVAYIREGDSNEWITMYKNAGCRVEDHERRYRSVHYEVKVGITKEPIIAEIQVRTIHEESWSELDHAINYPVQASLIIQNLLSTLNQLAGISDELSAYTMYVFNAFEEQKAEIEMLQNSYSAKLSETEELINRLEVKEAEKTKIKEKLKDLETKGNSAMGFSESNTVFSTSGLQLRTNFAAPIFGSNNHDPTSAVRRCARCKGFLFGGSIGSNLCAVCSVAYRV